MRIESRLPEEIPTIKQAAREIERAGFDGLWASEAAHAPFLQVLAAAEATSDLSVGTSVAIAFARSPMTVAYEGYDLAHYARGRFVLGLGSQVRSHVLRRFSMPWSSPAERMREFVSALRAIWESWHRDTPLEFRGDFYDHTLMPPYFTPAPHDFGPPPVYLAGVGTRMTEVAGEVCDGFFVHPFTTQTYLEDVTVPALLRGRARAGHDDLAGFTVAAMAFVCAGRDEQELAAAVRGAKDRIAFYGSTPSYRAVLELHGWGDLQSECRSMSKAGRWSEMADLIDDDVLRAFAVVGSPAEVAEQLHHRWATHAQRLIPYAPYPTDLAIWSQVLDAAREGHALPS